MAVNARALVTSVVLVACGGGNDTLFVPKNGAGGSDAGPSAGSATSTGGSGGPSSGGRNSGGSSQTGGTVGNPQTDGSTSTGGTRSLDGSTDGSSGGVDGSADSSAGSGGANGDAGGNGPGGAGGSSTGGKGNGGRGSGGKGGATGDGGTATGTPGVIACEGTGTPCTIAGTIPNVCCAGGLTAACLPALPGCVQFGAAVACDDAADCPTGSICCRTAFGTAACAKTCTGNQTQLCRTNAECKAGQCQPLSQAPEYSSCQ